MYGIDLTKAGSSKIFGLNTGVKLVDFKFNPNGGSEGSLQDSIDIVFNIGGKEESNRQFPVTKVKDWKNDVEITDPTHRLFKAAVKKFNNYMTQLLLCFVEKEELEATFASEAPTSFREYAGVCKQIIGEDFADVSLDTFMHYQHAISPGNTIKYLELPRFNHVNQGSWIAVTPEGEYKQDKSEDGLVYKDVKTGKTHLISRNASWMQTERARSGAPSANQDTDNSGGGDVPFSFG